MMVGHFRNISIFNCNITTVEEAPIAGEYIAIELWNFDKGNAIYNINSNTWHSYVNHEEITSYLPLGDESNNLSLRNVKSSIWTVAAIHKLLKSLSPALKSQIVTFRTKDLGSPFGPETRSLPLTSIPTQSLETTSSQISTVLYRMDMVTVPVSSSKTQLGT